MNQIRIKYFDYHRKHVFKSWINDEVTDF
jgi:hypothetical protein